MVTFERDDVCECHIQHQISENSIAVACGHLVVYVFGFNTHYFMKHLMKNWPEKSKNQNHPMDETHADGLIKFLLSQ